MRVFTDAIDERGYFDPRYTCDLDNSSPELRWEDIPPGTAGFALTAEDITANDGNGGPFYHWVVYNIPPEIFHLPAGIPPQDKLPHGIRQGLNGYGKLGYAGPCPPKSGKGPHAYRFTLYALSALPELPAKPKPEELLSTIRPHLLETSEIVGQYSRSLRQAG